MEIFVINIRKYFVVMCFVLAGMCKTSFSMNCFAKFKAKRLEMEAQAKKIHPLFYAIHQDADLKVIEFLLKNGLQKHINGCNGKIGFSKFFRFRWANALG